MADELYYYEWEFNRWLGSGTRPDMTLEDRAIYRDLLDHQAANGSLPDDVSGLANRAMCSVGQMNAFLQRWGTKLFPIGDDGARRNAVLQANREDIIARRDKKSAAGSKGAFNRWHGKRKGENDGGANGSAIGDANAKAMASNNQNKNKKKKEPPKPPKGGSPADFDSWWDSYPHKVGKAAARKAYMTARKSADTETLLGAVAEYARTKPHDRPWCNPATWLSQERWEDQPATGATVRPVSGLASLTDSERADLWRFVVSREPGAAHMNPGFDSARPLMKKHLDEWRLSK